MISQKSVLTFDSSIDIPKLNAVGRKFAASGMTQSLKNTDANSSGMDLNPSVMFKSIYKKIWDLPTSSGKIKETPTSDGDLEVPKKASLYVGGRVSELVLGYGCLLIRQF